MQTKIVTLVVLALVCFTSALRVVNQNEDKTLACCGSSATYDTTKQICCITNVVPIPTPGSGLQDVCCGNRLLRETEQCCEAVPGEPSILDRAIDSSATCCGTNALTDPSSQFCCDGTVVSNPNNLNQCCGRRLITSDDLCCAGTVVVGGTAAGKQCCGSTAFDPSTQSCCDGRVQSTTNGNQCCGTGTFNPATQTCCGGKATTGTSLTCCGDRGFNPSTQICCENELSGETSVLPNTNGNLQCCGNTRTFDPTSQTCCFVDQDNYVKDGKDDDGCAIYVNKPKRTYSVGNVANGDCCNGVAYNPATSLCCLDRVVNNPNNKQCCGRNLFDPSQDLCCPDADDLNAKVIAGRADDGVQCCGTTTFNPTTQGCACEKVVSISNDLFQSNTNPNVNPGCCGATQFDQNDKLCCSSANGNYLFNLDPAAGLKCCDQDGKTVYNPGYQVCCKKEKKKCPGKPSTPPPVGYVSPSSASNSPNQDRDLIQCGDSCCNGVGFFKMFQKCCDDEVVDFNNDAGSADTNPLACCGKTIYNQIFESCCIETVNGRTNTAVYGGPGNWQLCCKNE